jgi:hypothetical protein
MEAEVKWRGFLSKRDEFQEEDVGHTEPVLKNSLISSVAVNDRGTYAAQ